MENTIVVTQYHDYTPVTTLPNTTEISFQTSGNAIDDAIFLASQFGGSNISNNVLIVGDSNQTYEYVVVKMGLQRAFQQLVGLFKTMTTVLSSFTAQSSSNLTITRLRGSPETMS